MAIEQNTTTAKEKILKKVRQSLIFKSKALYANLDLESNVYAQPPAHEPILETFARNFTQANGQFVFCDNRFDFIDKFLTLVERKKLKNILCWEDELQNQLKESGIPFIHEKTGIDKITCALTTCEALVARTGSLLVSSAKNGRAINSIPPLHIEVGFTSPVVMEMKDAMQIIRNRYGRNTPGMLCFTTGPSRTTDIDNTLAVGAHGPEEVFVFLIDDQHTV